MTIQIMLIIMAVSFGTGAGSGYWLRDTMADADKSQVLEAERTELGRLKKINAELTEKSLDQKVETKIEYRYRTRLVKDETPKIQKANSDCNVSSNTVKLLNDFTVPKNLAPK